MFRFCWLSFLCCILTLAVGGCRNVDFSSVPMADELGLMDVQPVPQEIVERYGPTAKDRLDEIRRQRKKAAKATAEVQEQLTEKWAQQIQAEPNPFLRQEIVRALTECQTPLAAKILRAGLNDENTDVQIQCCRGWGKWGTPESVQVLGEVLGNKVADLDVKIAAIDGLQKAAQVEAAPFLVPLLDKREDPALQHKALDALQNITGRDLPHDQEAWQAYVTKSLESTPGTEGNSVPSLVRQTLFWWR